MGGRRAIPFLVNPVRGTIMLAVRLYGKKRGYFLAGEALGIAPETARKIADGLTSGASISDETAIAARLEFSRQRSAQLRAELAALESHVLNTPTDSFRLALGRRRLP